MTLSVLLYQTASFAFSIMILRLLSLLVFVQYSLIIWRRPGGSAGESVTPAATLADPSPPTRSSVDVSRGVRKNTTKNIAFWVPIRLHFGSIWHPNWVHFGIIFRYSFWVYSRCVFFENCGISDPANPQFWCSRRGAVRFFEFSSNRKQIQNERKISPKWLPKSTKKPLKIKTKIN